MKNIENNAHHYYDVGRVNDIETVKKMIEKRSDDIDFTCRVISYGAHESLMKNLLEKRNGDIDWVSSFIYGCRSGDINYMKFLMESLHEYNYNPQSLYLISFVHHASDNVDMLNYLLSLDLNYECDVYNRILYTTKTTEVFDIIKDKLSFENINDYIKATLEDEYRIKIRMNIIQHIFSCYDINVNVIKEY